LAPGARARATAKTTATTANTIARTALAGIAATTAVAHAVHAGSQRVGLLAAAGGNALALPCAAAGAAALGMRVCRNVGLIVSTRWGMAVALGAICALTVCAARATTRSTATARTSRVGIPTPAATTPTAAAAASSATAAFLLANALHHFLARGFGGCGHHVAAGGFAKAAPNGLAAHGNGLGALGGIGRKFGHVLARDALFGKALNIGHKALFVQANQADRLAFFASAACAANAVNVVFAHVGNFVVNDVG
jgi:hypothetical protein